MDRRTTLIAPFALAAGAALLSDRSAHASSVLLSSGAYKTQVLQYGTLSIETSLIARHRSANAYVKAFALGEILEQTAVGQSLTDMAKPKPAPLTPAQMAVLAMIQNASDADFDVTYLTAQHQAHEDLLVLQQEFLGSNPIYSNQLVHTALVATAFIQNHLYILKQLLTTGA